MRSASLTIICIFNERIGGVKSQNPNTVPPRKVLSDEWPIDNASLESRRLQALLPAASPFSNVPPAAFVSPGTVSGGRDPLSVADVWNNAIKELTAVRDFLGLPEIAGVNLTAPEVNVIGNGASLPILGQQIGSNLGMGIGTSWANLLGSQRLMWENLLRQTVLSFTNTRPRGLSSASSPDMSERQLFASMPPVVLGGQGVPNLGLAQAGLSGTLSAPVLAPAPNSGFLSAFNLLNFPNIAAPTDPNTFGVGFPQLEGVLGDALRQPGLGGWPSLSNAPGWPTLSLPWLPAALQIGGSPPVAPGTFGPPGVTDGAQIPMSQISVSNLIPVRNLVDVPRLDSLVSGENAFDLNRVAGRLNDLVAVNAVAPYAVTNEFLSVGANALPALSNGIGALFNLTDSSLRSGIDQVSQLGNLAGLGEVDIINAIRSAAGGVPISPTLEGIRAAYLSRLQGAVGEPARGYYVPELAGAIPPVAIPEFAVNDVSLFGRDIPMLGVPSPQASLLRELQVNDAKPVDAADRGVESSSNNSGQRTANPSEAVVRDFPSGIAPGLALPANPLQPMVNAANSASVSPFWPSAGTDAGPKGALPMNQQVFPGLKAFPPVGAQMGVQAIPAQGAWPSAGAQPSLGRFPSIEDPLSLQSGNNMARMVQPLAGSPAFLFGSQPESYAAGQAGYPPAPAGGPMPRDGRALVRAASSAGSAKPELSVDGSPLGRNPFGGLLPTLGGASINLAPSWPASLPQLSLGSALTPLDLGSLVAPSMPAKGPSCLENDVLYVSSHYGVVDDVKDAEACLWICELYSQPELFVPACGTRNGTIPSPVPTISYSSASATSSPASGGSGGAVDLNPDANDAACLGMAYTRTTGECRLLYSLDGAYGRAAGYVSASALCAGPDDFRQPSSRKPILQEKCGTTAEAFRYIDDNSMPRLKFPPALIPSRFALPAVTPRDPAPADASTTPSLWNVNPEILSEGQMETEVTYQTGSAKVAMREVADWRYCAVACDDESDCKAWTYEFDEVVRSGVCYLATQKEPVAQASAERGVVSGKRIATFDPAIFGVPQKPTDILSALPNTTSSATVESDVLSLACAEAGFQFYAPPVGPLDAAVPWPGAKSPEMCAQGCNAVQGCRAWQYVAPEVAASTPRLGRVQAAPCALLTQVPREMYPSHPKVVSGLSAADCAAAEQGETAASGVVRPVYGPLESMALSSRGTEQLSFQCPITGRGYPDGQSIRGRLLTDGPNVFPDCPAPRDCHARCTARSGCAGWSWGRWRACYLFSTVEAFIPDSSTVIYSGFADCTLDPVAFVSEETLATAKRTADDPKSERRRVLADIVPTNAEETAQQHTEAPLRSLATCARASRGLVVTEGRRLVTPPSPEPITSAAACWNFCRTTPGCLYMTYLFATQECQMWHEATKTEPSPATQAATAESHCDALGVIVFPGSTANMAIVGAVGAAMATGAAVVGTLGFILRRRALKRENASTTETMVTEFDFHDDSSSANTPSSARNAFGLTSPNTLECGDDGAADDDELLPAQPKADRFERRRDLNKSTGKRMRRVF